MTALVLFPSRIRFVNEDGTLTPEAYRSLQEIVNRTGGVLGSAGSDTYGDIVGDASKTDVNVAYTDVQQDVAPDRLMAELILQTPSYQTPTASGGAAPAGGVGTAAGGWDTAAHRDSAITLLNNIRTALIAAGIMT